MIEKIKNVNKGCLVATIVPICITGILILVCGVSAFFPMSPVKFAGVLLRVDISKGTIVISDNYDGENFPTGDGHTWTVLQIPPEKIDEFTNTLKTSPIWKPLPLPPELAKNERFLQPTIMFGLDGTIPIEGITGYYVFIDRQEERNKKDNRYDPTPVFERPSYNYTFGLFNDKDGKLYVWSIDT